MATQGAESAVYDCLVLNLGSGKQRQTSAQGVQFFEPTILFKYAKVRRQLGANEGEVGGNGGLSTKYSMYLASRTR